MPGLSPRAILRHLMPGGMKAHQHKQSKSTPFNTYPTDGRSYDRDLESVAENLVELARARLPDNVIHGALKGCEGDIRQEAVLLAMKWHIRRKVGDSGHSLSCWNAAQAICAALRYCKLNAIKRHAKEQQARRSFGAIQSQHEDYETGTEEWPPSEIRQILEKSIQQALQSGLISQANASIALLVYIEGVAVKDLAKGMNRTKGAIHQQLNRVKKAIPGIVQSMRGS